MIDFHCHSTASDGTYSPKDLVAKAINSNITHLALTDHDTTDGIDEFLSCKTSNIELIAGIEVSVEYTNGQLHIVGLFIDKNSSSMEELVEEVKEYRKERNEKILSKMSLLLKKTVKAEDLLDNPKGMLGRPHMAKYLVKNGIVPTIQDAFNEYLGDNMILSVPKTQISIDRALKVIKDSGGISILAHPTSLKLDDVTLDIKVKEYKEKGLNGIEVFSSKSPNEKKETYLNIAKKHNLLISCGSDFHGGNSKVLNMGADIGDMDKYDIINPMYNLVNSRR